MITFLFENHFRLLVLVLFFALVKFGGFVKFWGNLKSEMADGIMTSIFVVAADERRYSFLEALLLSELWGRGGGITHALHHSASKWQYIMTDVLDELLDPHSDTLVGPVLIKREWICYLSFYSY